jgi:hypothetical protein
MFEIPLFKLVEFDKLTKSRKLDWLTSWLKGSYKILYHLLYFYLKNRQKLLIKFNFKIKFIKINLIKSIF